VRWEGEKEREDEETKRRKRKVDERWCGLLGQLKHSVLSRFDSQARNLGESTLSKQLAKPQYCIPLHLSLSLSFTSLSHHSLSLSRHSQLELISVRL
jgi:hypothetical protein